MKNLFLFLLLWVWTFTLSAQTDIELILQHKFEKSSFSLGQTYMTTSNQAIQISRLQYYLSDLELTHDGGQVFPFSNTYLLINGQQDNYQLGNVPATIEALEYIDFNLGLDAITNQNTPSDFAAGHPLENQDMYTTAQTSYIFLVIEGSIDTDNDNIPDAPFVLRATNDDMLRHINLQSKLTSSDGNLKINLTVNIAKWLENIDLSIVGVQENNGIENAMMMDNTVDYTVFSSTETTSVETLVSPKNHIFVDSRLTHMPTIYYKFFTAEQLDMTITNVTGTYFIQRFDLNPEGDFLMNDDLASGIYIVVFTSPRGIRQSKRFVISR